MCNRQQLFLMTSLLFLLCCCHSQIRSDWDGHGTMYYALLGPGASRPPVNVFVVDESTGLVCVRGKLDREERETYIVRTQFNSVYDSPFNSQLEFGI